MAPFSHFVPVATGWKSGVPAPVHRANCVPLAEQIIWPADEQDDPVDAEPLGAAEPVALVPEGTVLGVAAAAGAAPEVETEAEPEPAAVAEGEAEGEALGDGEAKMVAVLGVAEIPLGAAADGVAEAELLPEEPEPEELLPEPPRLMLGRSGQFPFGGTSGFVPAFWTTLPAFGNCRSEVSTVVQPLSMLAASI